MKIKKFIKLSNEDIINIKNLIEQCRNKDNIQYDPYLGEEGCLDDIFILAYHKNILVGYLYCFANDIPEVSVYIHPEYRRQGIATKLIKKLPHKNFVLTGKDFYPGGFEFADSIGYTKQYHEFLMEFDATTSIPHTGPCHVKKDDTYELIIDGQTIAAISIFEEAHTINIYDIFVIAPERNKGYGRQLLTSVLAELTSANKRIILQVSEENVPAYKLYTTMGFSVIDSVLFIKH